MSFIIQKVLIRDDRAREKRAQDVLYIYDAMYLFSGAIEDELVPVWKSLEATLSDAQRKSITAGVDVLFSAVNDRVREAVTNPTDRKVDPEDMVKLSQNGFEELFGGV